MPASSSTARCTTSTAPPAPSRGLRRRASRAGTEGASASGHPLYTPTVLGTAIFRRAALATPETLSVSLEMVGMFTWIHVLIFAALGGVASRLLAMVERNPSWGFGLLLLFVVFEFGFVAAAALLASPILRVIPWPSVLGANLLAAAAMSAYFWRRHPHLVVSP